MTYSYTLPLFEIVSEITPPTTFLNILLFDHQVMRGECQLGLRRLGLEFAFWMSVEVVVVVAFVDVVGTSCRCYLVVVVNLSFVTLKHCHHHCHFCSK